MSGLSTYNLQEIKQYFERIRFPYDINSLKPNLETLQEIAKHHELAIPFGGLDYVYFNKSSKEAKKNGSLDPSIVFDKLVTCKREGYCAEHATLLDNILAYIGFKTFVTYASLINYDKRKHGIVEYNGDVHFMNIVTIDNYRYIVDLGFGIPGAPTVIPIDGKDLKNSKFRVRKLDSINGQMVYVYEECFKGSFFPHSIFHTIPYTVREIKNVKLYCDFETVSILEKDLIVSLATESGHVCLINNLLTVREHGKTTRRKIETENERRQVYHELFGIGPIDGLENLPQNMRSSNSTNNNDDSLGLLVKSKASEYNLPEQFVSLNNYIYLKEKLKPKL